MKRIFLILVLGMILVSGCGETLKENITTNQESINNSCTQDNECEALFFSCSCNYTCTKKTGEPREDCARECINRYTEPVPNCRCVGGDCSIVEEEQPCFKKMQESWDAAPPERGAKGYIGLVFEDNIKKEEALAILKSFNLTNHNLEFPYQYDCTVQILNATNKEYIDWISDKKEVMDLSDPTMLYVTVVFPINISRDKAKAIIYSSPFEVKLLSFWQLSIRGKVSVEKGTEGYWFCRLQNITGIRYTYMPNDSPTHALGSTHTMG